VSQVGKHPKVMLWRPDDLQRVQTLTHKNCRAVIALAFSPDASRLLACGADNQHTIHVWDWKKGSLLCCMAGQNGTPPQVPLLSRPAAKEVVDCWANLVGEKRRGRPR